MFNLCTVGLCFVKQFDFNFLKNFYIKFMWNYDCD